MVDPTLLHDRSDYSKQSETSNTYKMRTQIFKEPVFAYAAHVKEAPLEIHFAYLGNKKTC
jgi:hypothetical protein